MRAFARLWDELLEQRYGVSDAEAAPVPVRRPGQLARADRGAAGEQRPADRPGDARRSRCPATPGPGRSSCRPGTRRSGCRGRGTSSGRCGSSRCWRTSRTCWSTTTCSPARVVVETEVAPSWSRPRARRWRGLLTSAVRSRRWSGLHEGGAGRLAREPTRPDRVRGRGRRRGQPLHDDRTEPAHGRPGRRRSRPSTPTWRRPRWRPFAAGGRSATRTRPVAYGRSGPSSGCGPRLRARPTSSPRPWSAPAPT